MNDGLIAAGLLVCSNTFMTIAWYGHLKSPDRPLWIAVLLSWGIAFFEYCLQVPGNRIGYRSLTAYQLKIMQEAITLVVFIGFSWFWLDEKITLRHAASFGLIIAAVIVGWKK